MEVVDNTVQEVGDWDDIVRFCAEVSQALAAAGADNQDFEAWRPKQDEPVQDVRDRTVDEESLEETRFETASNGIRADAEQVGRDVRDSGSALLNGRARTSARKAEAASETTVTGLVAMLSKLVRGLEAGIYRHIVEPANPDYFEGEHVSAALHRTGILDHRYRCHIMFENPDIRSSVIDALTE